ncbi:hypothetical protein CK227_17545 [Mesorhizobium sp. WSM4308]|nr:hypothetical protein CK232_20205 [Mesorhizobium sp. WSM4304]PBB73870.1 hypothetical protein CK227_17545 [Mesorhizobium sp. WSM4308]
MVDKYLLYVMTGIATFVYLSTMLEYLEPMQTAFFIDSADLIRFHIDLASPPSLDLKIILKFL